MPSPFSITVPTNSIPLDGSRRGSMTFTVYNASGRPMRGRARLAPENPAAQPWLTLAGEPERSFAIAATEQYTVQINVPREAPPASYGFRLDMVGVERPDEDYTQGPAVTLVVGGPAYHKPFPWWIVVLAVLGVLAIGSIGYGFARYSQNRQARAATATAQAGTAVAAAALTATANAANAVAIANQQTATAQLAAQQTANAQAAAAQQTAAAQTLAAQGAAQQTAAAQTAAAQAATLTATALTPPPTATWTPTGTPAPTATPTATPPPTPTATHVPGTVMEDFLGAWINTDPNTSGMTRVVINKVNNTMISVQGYGKCSPSDCDWGVVNVPFTPLKVIATWDFGFKKTTISLQRAGGELQAEVFDDYVPSDSRKDVTNYYTFKYQFIIVDIIKEPIRILPTKSP